MRAGGGRVIVACFMAACGGVNAAWAEHVPARGTVDGRVRTALYDSDEVYRLHGFVGYQIDLEFEAGETFTGLGAGDIEGLAYGSQDNHLFLKPKAAKLATNLTVLTNRRHYQFEYSVQPQRSVADDTDVIFALRFSYAPSVVRTELDAAVERLDNQLRTAGTERARNVDYWYCGGPSLRPIAASDDGVHTRIRFAANAELPAIFVRNDDNSESLLNFSMDGGDVVVHRTASRFLLRRGKLTGCVVNKGFAGSGSRLESGTVTPHVERRVRGAAP